MKVIKRIADLLVTAIFTLLLVFGIVFLMCKVVGVKFYAVRTGSMQDVYPVGTLVAVRQISPDEIISGDVITFVTTGDTVVTHRVVTNDTEHETLITKGDENNTTDSAPVEYKNVLGRAFFGIPYVGYVVLLLKGRTYQVIAYIVLTLCLIYLLGIVISSIVRSIRRRR